MRNIYYFFRNNLALIIAGLWLASASYLSFLYFRVFEFSYATTPDPSSLKIYLQSMWFKIVFFMIILSVNFVIVLLATRWRIIAKLFLFISEPLILLGIVGFFVDTALHPQNSDNHLGALGLGIFTHIIILPMAAGLLFRVPFMALLLSQKNKFKAKMLYLIFSCLVIVFLLGNYILIARSATVDAHVKAKTLNFQLFKPAYVPESMTGYSEGVKGGKYYFGWDVNDAEKKEYRYMDIKVEEQKAGEEGKQSELFKYDSNQEERLSINGMPAKLYVVNMSVESARAIVTWIDSGTTLQVYVYSGFSDLPDIKAFVRSEAIRIAESMKPVDNLQ